MGNKLHPYYQQLLDFLILAGALTLVVLGYMIITGDIQIVSEQPSTPTPNTAPEKSSSKEDDPLCEKEIIGYMVRVFPKKEPPEGMYMTEPFGRAFCTILVMGPMDVPQPNEVTALCSLETGQQEDSEGFLFEAENLSPENIEPLIKVQCQEENGETFQYYEWFSYMYPFPEDLEKRFEIFNQYWKPESF